MSEDEHTRIAAELIRERRSGGIGRRTFLQRMSAALVAGAWLPGLEAADSAPAAIRRAIAAAQDHLFPATPGAPGAADLNAGPYLEAVLADPLIDPREKTFLRGGLDSLDAYARRRHGVVFADLDAERGELLLRRIEQDSPGRDWIALMLYYVLEALLTDPVHGGNPQGVGWRWLEHQPGFPRPPIAHPWFDA